MLSTSTIDLLTALQERSHAVFTEGGVLYTYIEAANQAHFRYPAGAAAQADLSPEDFGTLRRFIRTSLNEAPAGIAKRSSSLAGQLIERLRDDLTFDEIVGVFEDDGDSLNANLMMVRRADNRFFALELFWSVD